MVLPFFQDFIRNRDFAGSIALIRSDASLLEHLFDYIRNGIDREQSYASWLLQHYFEKYPEDLSGQRLHRAQEIFVQTNHPGVVRNMAGVLYHALPGTIEDGVVLDCTFEYLLNPEVLPAVVFQCLRMADKHFVGRYPELKPELCAIIESYGERDKPSFRSMQRKYRKKWCTPF